MAIQFRKIADNIKAGTNGDFLYLKIDLTEAGNMSQSGKSEIIARTLGQKGFMGLDFEKLGDFDADGEEYGMAVMITKRAAKKNNRKVDDDDVETDNIEEEEEDEKPARNSRRDRDEPEAPEPKRRGRPPGRKNAEPEAPEPKRRSGRNVVDENEREDRGSRTSRRDRDEPVPAKRPVGRPPGRKNAEPEPTNNRRSSRVTREVEAPRGNRNNKVSRTSRDDSDIEEARGGGRSRR